MSGRSRPAASQAGQRDFRSEIAVPGRTLGTVQAERPPQLAVQVDQPLAAGAVVQVVDVLGDQQELARPAALELRQGEVGGVRHDRRVAQLRPARIVEPLDEPGIAGEGTGCRDVLGAVPLP